MNFTHSFASNHELSVIMRTTTAAIKENKVRYIFVPFCLWKPVDAWNLYLTGNANTLYEWLNARFKVARQQILLEQVFNHFSRKHIVLLFDSILENDKYINTYISKLFENLNSSNVGCKTLFINTRNQDSDTFDHSIQLPYSIKQYIMDTSSSFETLILSRLDNDDMFCLSHDETLLRVSESLRKSKEKINKPLLVDFPLGLQFVKKHNMTYSTLWPENNFASIMTNHDEIKTKSISVPFEYNHDYIPDELMKITVSTLSAQWLQIVHGSNLANKLFPWSRHVGTMTLASGLSRL